MGEYVNSATRTFFDTYSWYDGTWSGKWKHTRTAVVSVETLLISDIIIGKIELNLTATKDKLRDLYDSLQWRLYRGVLDSVRENFTTTPIFHHAHQI